MANTRPGLPRAPIPRVSLGLFAAALDHRAPLLRGSEQPLQRRPDVMHAERVHVVRRVARDFRKRAGRGGQDGHAGRHRLGHRESESFIQRGIGKQRRARHDGRQFVFGDVTEAPNPLRAAQDARPGGSIQAARHAHQHQVVLLAQTGSHGRPGVEQATQILPGLQRARNFEEQNHSNAIKLMRQELDALVAQVPEGKSKAAFAKEMDGFFELFLRYTRTADQKIEWQNIKSPNETMIIPYTSLAKSMNKERDQAALSKLAILKLNGGLGTTMGCVGPKSAIEVRDGMNFLDLTVRQIEWLNKERNVNIPLLLMNSFNTDAETRKIIQKYGRNRINIVTFNQSRYPRIGKDSLLPVPDSPKGDKDAWYPPGHGDLFDSLRNSGLLDELLAEKGKNIYSYQILITWGPQWILPSFNI